jgi:hypothetical protein
MVQRFRTVTIRSQVLPLPRAFVEYLLADGVVLPDSATLSGAPSVSGHGPSK